MSASLVEMVLAISIAGLIFAAALVPMTSAVVTYQETEAQARASDAHAIAAVRAEQIAAGIWRDADPPGACGDLAAAAQNELTVGDWSFRQNAGDVQQSWQGGAGATLANSASSFSFEYLLTNGTWVTAAGGEELDEVVAARVAWTDAEKGVRVAGGAVPGDRCFSAGLLELPEPDTSEPYQRSDYERAWALSLGRWP